MPVLSVSRSHRPASGWRSTSLLAGVMGFAALGCGGGSPPAEPQAQQPAAADSSQPAAAAPVKPATVPPAAANEAARVDANGRKWIGKIPYDVWFDNPLAVVANSQQVAAATPGSTAAPATATPMPETPMPETAKPAGGAIDWKSLIPATIVEAEAKKLRNRLTENLQSVGRYNGAVKDVQWDGATMAAIGAIAIEHPDAIAWKENAKYVRELGVQVELGAEGPGKKWFDAAQLPFEKFVTILNGSTPPDLPEAEDTAELADKVSRSGVMNRMQKAFDWLSKNIITADKFTEEIEGVQHETAILAAFVKISAADGYAFADEAEFQKHANEMLDATTAMQKAIAAQQFDGFQEGLGRVQKKCDECHNAGYRFGE